MTGLRLSIEAKSMFVLLADFDILGPLGWGAFFSWQFWFGLVASAGLVFGISFVGEDSFADSPNHRTVSGK